MRHSRAPLQPTATTLQLQQVWFMPIIAQCVHSIALTMTFVTASSSHFCAPTQSSYGHDVYSHGVDDPGYHSEGWVSFMAHQCYNPVKVSLRSGTLRSVETFVTVPHSNFGFGFSTCQMAHCVCQG